MLVFNRGGSWRGCISAHHPHLYEMHQLVNMFENFNRIGYVFEAIDPHTGESVAIKRTSKSGEYVSREFEVLDRLRGCENVVQLLNIYYSKNEEGKVV